MILDPQPTPLNDPARAVLAGLRATKAKQPLRLAECEAALEHAWYARRDAAIVSRANRLYIRFDPEVLRRLFLEREEAGDLDIPTADVDEDDEPWAMALQLGVEGFRQRPPVDLPAWNRATVLQWLAAEPPAPARCAQSRPTVLSFRTPPGRTGLGEMTQAAGADVQILLECATVRFVRRRGFASATIQRITEVSQQCGWQRLATIGEPA